MHHGDIAEAGAAEKEAQIRGGRTGVGSDKVLISETKCIDFEGVFI